LQTGVNVEIYNGYKYDLKNITCGLTSKLGGFTSKEKFRLLLDSKSPSSTSNVFVPDENYDIFLNTNSPIQKINYSGVVIQKTVDGFEVRGYNFDDPYFDYYQPQGTGRVVNIGGISESFLNWSTGQVYRIQTIVRQNNQFFKCTVSHTSTDNFDQTKFGDGLSLPEESINTINDAATDIELSDWQLNDLANNNVITTNYFVNPVANVCNSLTANLSNLISSIATLSVIDANSSALLNSSINCMVQIDRFKSHTDNVSGVAETSGSDTIPCYVTAINTGQTLLTILNKTDGISNSLPAMGSFTSIFIEPELNANNTSLGSNCRIYINSVSSNTTNLSSSSINSIKTVVDNLNNFLYSRWTHDWTFYGNSISLLNDYFKIDYNI
jgi:hypothetical protein